ncbi:MAG: metallophosphoesterase [Bacteroidota bacterium]
MAGRKLVMGDIHGNLDAFNQCMERSSFDKKVDTLIQLGDVSNRHSQTAEVVEELLTIPLLIALRGNHDSMTQEWLLKGIKDVAWLENGGFNTVISYQRNNGVIDKEKHRRFFSEIQRDFYVDSDGRVFVHGGFTNPEGPAYEIDSAVCYWDRNLWRNALQEEDKMKKPDLLANFNEIYIGHTPTLNWGKSTPMKAFNIWNLDTGAGTTGKLTIMDIETKEFWQSD